MSQKLKIPAKIGTTIKKAIRNLDEPKGSSFAAIKKYLMSVYQTSDDVLDSTSIKLYLKDAVDKGDLLKLDNAKYKVKETARRRRSRRSKSRSRSRKRSGGRQRSRSGGRKRRRSRSGSRKRKRSTSGRRRKRATSGRRRRSRRSKMPVEDE